MSNRVRVPTTGANEIAAFQSRAARLRSESRSLAKDLSAFLQAQGIIRDAGVALLEGSEVCAGFYRLIDKYIGRGFTEQDAETLPEPAANQVINIHDISRPKDRIMKTPTKYGFEATFLDGVKLRGTSFNKSTASVEIAMQRLLAGANTNRELEVVSVERIKELDVNAERTDIDLAKTVQILLDRINNEVDANQIKLLAESISSLAHASDWIKYLKDETSNSQNSHSEGL